MFSILLGCALITRNYKIYDVIQRKMFKSGRIDNISMTSDATGGRASAKVGFYDDI